MFCQHFACNIILLATARMTRRLGVLIVLHTRFSVNLRPGVA